MLKLDAAQNTAEEEPATEELSEETSVAVLSQLKIRRFALRYLPAVEGGTHRPLRWVQASRGGGQRAANTTSRTDKRPQAG